MKKTTQVKLRKLIERIIREVSDEADYINPPQNPSSGKPTVSKGDEIQIRDWRTKKNFKAIVTNVRRESEGWIVLYKLPGEQKTSHYAWANEDGTFEDGDR